MCWHSFLITTIPEIDLEPIPFLWFWLALRYFSFCTYLPIVHFLTAVVLWSFITMVCINMWICGLCIWSRKFNYWPEFLHNWQKEKNSTKNLQLLTCILRVHYNIILMFIKMYVWCFTVNFVKMCSNVSKSSLFVQFLP